MTTPDSLLSETGDTHEDKTHDSALSDRSIGLFFWSNICQEFLVFLQIFVSQNSQKKKLAEILSVSETESEL